MVERDRNGFSGDHGASSSGNWPVARRVPSGLRSAESARALDRATELEPIVRVLECYLSAVNLRLLLERALREKNLTLDTFKEADLPKIGGALRRGVELFVKEDRRRDALQDIASLCGNESLAPGPSTTMVVSESDIVMACNHARKLCADAGAKSFAVHKVMTIVSELGRNIVSYAGGGRIELAVERAPSRRVIIRAIDEGPGIGNVQEILSGRYKSKTGLGKGLLGTKRLSDQFDISTGTAGTTVVAEILL